MACGINLIEYSPGETFRKTVYLRQGDGAVLTDPEAILALDPVDLTGASAVLDFEYNGESVMLFSSAHDAGPDAGEGQITITGAEGKLVFYADESVATALVDEASGNLLVTIGGTVTAYACYVIRSCEC